MSQRELNCIQFYVRDSKSDRSHSRLGLAEAIGDKIVRQLIPAGRSVGEVALATEMGVSRTPVREALLGLEREGLVRAQRGRGFIVQPLSASEAREVYPIIAGLERLALESVKSVPDDLVDNLRALNRAMARAQTVHERIKLDSDWHREIVSLSGNDRLQRLIEGVKQTALRYEYAYLKSMRLRDKSVAEHEQIADLLARSPAMAADALSLHWREGLEGVLGMLEGG